MPASEGTERCIKVYAGYSVASKFPNVIDGLKPVHRRILLTIHEHPGLQKEATLAGQVMKMHPHGDASISDAISGMAQPFTNIIPLVSSKSSLGTYSGENAAKARYVDVYESELACDLFFERTDSSALHWDKCESEDGVEPKNFVPVIPTTLVIPMPGIAVGFKTETSAVSLANACELTKKYIELKYKNPDTWRKKTGPLLKYLLPDFPSYCVLRNSKKILKEYAKGNFSCSFVLDGIFEIYKDSIIIASLPPGRAFGSVTEDAGRKTITEKDSWHAKYFSEMADYGDKNQRSTSGNFKCVLRRGVNPFDILATFKKQLQLSASWTPSRLYYDAENEVMTEETPFTLLYKWSEARARIVLGGLNQQLMRLFEHYHQIKALVIVADHDKEVTEIFRNAKDETETVAIIHKRFNLSRFQAKYLAGLKLKQLTKKGKEELLADLEATRKAIHDHQEKYLRIPEIVAEDVERFEKKYAHQYPAKCVVPNYIGAACFRGTGWILFEKLEECDKIIAQLGTSDLTFKLFSTEPSVLGSDESIGDDVLIPKYIKASYLGGECAHPKYMSTIVADGALLCALPPDSYVGPINNNPVPVGDKFRVVTKDRCYIETASPKLVRQSRNATSATMRGVIHVSGLADEDVCVVHCNPKVPGTVTINRIVGDGRISSVVIGKTIVLGVFKPGEVMFTVPDEVAVRTSIRHIYIKNLAELVEPGKSVQLQLTKKKTSTGRNIVLKHKRSEIYTVS